MKNYFSNYFIKLNRKIESIDSELLLKASKKVSRTNSSEKKLIVVGNGGSAAMASHVSVDFTKAAGIRAVNFNEADLLTCLANDYGYEQWVTRTLEFYADTGNLAFLISSSGKFPNMINGAEKAKTMGLSLITLSGFSSEDTVRNFGDIDLWPDSQEYNNFERSHNVWLLPIVDYIIEHKKNTQ